MTITVRGRGFTAGLSRLSRLQHVFVLAQIRHRLLQLPVLFVKPPQLVIFSPRTGALSGEFWGTVKNFSLSSGDSFWYMDLCLIRQNIQQHVVSLSTGESDCHYLEQ